MLTKKKISFFKFEWSLPKSIFWLATIFVLLGPAFALGWFLLKFNIPFLHAGDQGVMIVFASTWWIATSTMIFGWKIKNNSTFKR